LAVPRQPCSRSADDNHTYRNDVWALPIDATTPTTVSFVRAEIFADRLELHWFSTDVVSADGLQGGQLAVGLHIHVEEPGGDHHRIDDPADCLAKFRANRWLGWILFFGIILGRVLAGRLAG
jgi:hypothetical protein